MVNNVLPRIREYLQSHGASYTVKRLGQKAAQLLLGTYERRRKLEQASAEELCAQRENQPDAGLISVVIPVFNTDPGMLGALLDSLEAQTYFNYEAILYDGGSTRTDTTGELKARCEMKGLSFEEEEAKYQQKLAADKARAEAKAAKEKK